MNMDPYREVEVYLKRAEDEISRSFTELTNLENQRKPPKTASKYLGPAARKKRFLSKRQRSRTVELSLPSLHEAAKPLESAKKVTISRNLSDVPSSAVSMDILPKSAPPLENNLPPSSENLHSRSISVRDLPTTPTSPYLLMSAINRRPKTNRSASPEWKSQSKLDFSKPETVSRWASEILAEIESLPGSSIDLSTGRQVAVVQPMTTTDLSESRRRLDEACSELRNLSVESLRPTNGHSEGENERKTPIPEENSADLDSTVTPTASPTRKGRPFFHLPPPPPPPIRQMSAPASSPRKKGRKHRKNTKKRRLDATTEVGTTTHTDFSGTTSDKKMESNFHRAKPLSHPDRSVRKVVANILRQAEENSLSSVNFAKKNIISVGAASKRHSFRTKSVQYDDDSAVFGDAEDDESSSSELERLPELLDACTQTSPFSLSRSSSFTWMSEGELEEQAQFERLVFPEMAVPAEAGFCSLSPKSENLNSSSTTDECDDSEMSDANGVQMARGGRPPETYVQSSKVTVVKTCSSGLTPDDDSLMLSDASGLASSEEESEAPPPAPCFRPSTPPRTFFCADSRGTSSLNQETIVQRTDVSPERTWIRDETFRGKESDEKSAGPSFGFDSAFDESLRLLLLYTTEEGVTLGPNGWKEPSSISPRSYPSPAVAVSSSSVSAFTPIRADAESRKPPSLVSKQGVLREEKFNSDAHLDTAGPHIQLTGDGVLVNRPTPLYASSQQFPGSPGQGRRLLVQSRKEEVAELQRSLQGMKKQRNILEDAAWIRYPPAASQGPPMAESIYDNVPNLRRQLASQGLLRPTVDSWSLIPEEKSAFSPGTESLISPAAPNLHGIPAPGMLPGLPRDISMASGILADSESSPVSPERERFAILDSNDAAAAATPDSVKSLTSSEGSFSLAMSGSHRLVSRDYHHPVLNANGTEVLHGDSVLALTLSSTDQLTVSSMLGDSIYDYPPDEPRDPPPPSPKSRSLCVPDAQAAKQQSLANSLPALDRTGSYEMLNSVSSSGPNRERGSNMMNSQGSDSGFSSSKEKAEAEAVECCKWLRAAGFPQYAQMYEDHKFPIDVKSVEKDHEFLDEADIQALFRRLHTLNRCAIMKLDSNVLMRRTQDDDSDEEDTVALSRKWRYQRKSKTWSRIANDLASVGLEGPIGTDSSTSPNLQTLDLTAPTGESLDSLTFDSMEQGGNGAGAKMTDSVHVMVASRVAKTAEDIFPPKRGGANLKLQRSQSERIKDKARAFMKRMGPTGSRRRKSTSREPIRREEIVIGSPVLVGHQSASPPAMRMFKGTAPVAQSSPLATVRVHEHRNTAEKMERRHGRVFLMSDSSTEFEKVDVSGSPIGYKNETFVDSNCNVDRVFLPKLPPTNPTGTSNANSNRSSGSRGNGPFQRAAVAPLPSPVLGRNAADGRQKTDSAEKPLVLFNPTYSTQRSDPTGKTSTNDKTSRNDQNLDSSPEFSVKNSRDELQQRSLRVRVDLEDRNRGPAGVQPSHSSMDSSESESPKYWEPPERRDSGVGSSLSRSPSGPTRSRVRWHSFQRQHRPVAAKCEKEMWQMDCLSVPQLIIVRQFALLRLTSLMEKYSRHGKTSANSGPSWNWGVQKLFRRIKSPEQKFVKDGSVFGVPFYVVAQRTGQPLPQGILHAMRFLRQQSSDAVGVFRKSGVRSRIQKLKEQYQNSIDLPNYEASQTFDVADMLKQYFRELPEPLLTTKLSETFIGIHLDVPSDFRLEAMQKCVLLLPDENREVLQSLLLFLYDVSRYANSNQMTAQNLAVCFAPSLFQLSPRLAAMSPTRRHKTIGGLPSEKVSGGLPNEKELRENQAAQACLTQMILDCKKLFLVPNSIRERCSLEAVNDDAEPSTLKELGRPNGNYVTHMEGCIATLLKEHRDRWKGWMTEGSVDGVEITYKKLSDSHPLKLWRCWADVEAPPKEVLERVLRERDSWDEDVLKWRVVERLGQYCELFQFVQNDMPPHPTREFCVLRLWKVDLSSLRGGCVLVETSVTSPEAEMIGGVRGVCLAARYLIEPSGAGKSRITYVCRIDTKGRGKSWYSKVFGYICARQIAHLRDSFRQTAEGPETKV